MSGRLKDNTEKCNKAVALKYHPQIKNAPTIIATGKGKVADKIVKIAREHNIFIHDDPDLVEVLARLDLNEEIPADLYVVVSELLAFVYGLNREEKNR